jgi:hypothetical protein
MMAMDSAVAIAGFGELEVTAPDGISLQNKLGTVKIDLSDEKIHVKHGESGGATFFPTGQVLFASGAQVTADGDVIESGGVSLRNHIHDCPEDGGPSSAPY